MTERAPIRAYFHIAAIIVLPLLAVLSLWRVTSHAAPHVPEYVVRVKLPPVGGLVGLPVIEGAPDASRPLVVIDAGHGGHDPGASGPNGQREKDITLDLAMSLREALIRSGRVRVAMTRADDRFLVLEERSGIARRLGADLFISIHADAADNPQASGATVYTLSDVASDAEAQRMAARENKSDVVNGVALGGQSNAVSSILVDLSRREAAANSVKFSDLVLREGQGKLPFHKDAKRKAGFVVLKSLDMPSVLLEAGYISNSADAVAMGQTEWRQGFAATLSSAIEIFLASQMQDQP